MPRTSETPVITDLPDRFVLGYDPSRAENDRVVRWDSETFRGLPGNDGEDGNTIWSGAGVPDNSLGNNGDIYYRTSTPREIYGPKSGGAWGAATVLQDGADGEPGDDGADGATILSGAAVPGGGVGRDGDFYIRLSDPREFYGPKAGGAWPAPVTIAGLPGTDGEDGTDGTNANQILSGTGVPANGTGANGDFYIKTTAPVTFYGPKASGTWPAGVSLAGTNGEDGTDAAAVLSGAAAPGSGVGANGDFYFKTTDPVTFYGPKAGGAWPTGVSLKGADGSPGTAGANGATIYSGAAAPSNGTGANGDFYFKTTDPVTFYGPKAAGAWPAGVSLKGADGSSGSGGASKLSGQTEVAVLKSDFFWSSLGSTITIGATFGDNQHYVSGTAGGYGAEIAGNAIYNNAGSVGVASGTTAGAWTGFLSIARWYGFAYAGSAAAYDWKAGLALYPAGASQTLAVRLGLLDIENGNAHSTYNATNSRGAWFENLVNNGSYSNWFCGYGNGGTPSFVETSVPGDASAFHSFRIRRTGTNIEWLIDDVVVRTLTNIGSLNLPTYYCRSYVGQVKNTGTVNATAFVLDYVEMYATLPAARK